MRLPPRIWALPGMRLPALVLALARRPSRLVPRPDPRERTMWYRRLPEARREELRREWLADQARTFALEASARRQLAQDSLAIAGIFALGDLSAPGGSLATILGVTAAGLLLGAILSMLRSDRLVSATAGLLAFFAYQWWSRDGLSGLHLFVLVLVACACAYVGARREEPGTG